MSKEEEQSLSPEDNVKSKVPGKFFCKTCNWEHKGKLDGPGYGHWPIEKGGKRESMYNELLSQPKRPLFIPLESYEKPGQLATCQLNGLKIAVYKGAYVDVPKQVAEVFMDSLNQTTRIPFDVKTAPNPFTGVRNQANLAMRAEEADTVRALDL